MDRFAVFVDAGYLFAAGSVLLTGEDRPRPRQELDLDNDATVQALTAFGKHCSGIGLLRVYWYDGTNGRPSAHQVSLAHLNNVKVRLGLVNSFGEQKGVDSLIITDMIALARNRAIADAVLLAGDEDLRVGVQQAQEHGVRVHLLGIAPSQRNQSQQMRQEADTATEWDRATIAGLLKLKAPTPPVAPPPSGGEAELAELAERTARDLTAEERCATLLAYRPSRSIPQDIDRRILRTASDSLRRELTPEEKRALRKLFIEVCEQIGGETVASPSL